MKICPDCGVELSAPDNVCPSCNKKVKKPFTIRDFLWENFRLFTMVGVTGTMISLIPNMGTRILGASWIVDADNYLPLFLSIIIFFGALFLTICFLLIFSLVLLERRDEAVHTTITLGSGKLLTWYEGDFERSILLCCLVPMWCGLILFFIMLMPLIPNTLSWLFAAVIGLAGIPLFIFALLGWKIGKTMIGKIPGLEKSPRLSMGVFIILVIGCLVLLFMAIPQVLDSHDPVPGTMEIRADQQYFSPQISSAKGLRLEITNISGRTIQASRHTWSADYGYFIRVVPSTSEVTILGNPVSDDYSREIYWTYSQNDPERNEKPVKIQLHIYPQQGNEELAGSSLYLTWYTNDIVYVNKTFEPLKVF
jgi:hypothetical protein